MGQFVAKGFEEAGNFFGGLIGGKAGNVFRNVFQYWGNGIRVVDDIMGLVTLGTSKAIEQSVAEGLNVSLSVAKTAAKEALGGVSSARGLVPDVLRAGSGLVRLLQDPAREDDINSWYNDNIDPYLSAVPGESQEGAWAEAIRSFQPLWLAPINKAINDNARDTKHATDLAIAQQRRFHDIQVRAAGDLIGTSKLRDIQDAGRRYNNVGFSKSNDAHRIIASVEQMAEAREIWERAKPDERRRIEGEISDTLKTERSAIEMRRNRQERGFLFDPTSRIVGPQTIAPAGGAPAAI